MQTKDATIGTFEINGQLKYYGLEPLNHIPAGTYPLAKYFSPAHNKEVPLVQNVPGHSYIEIHVGNWAKDTRDCLCLGESLGVDMILNSLVAINDFYPQFFAALAKGELCTIEYIDSYKN